MKNILDEIIEGRRKAISERGVDFGFSLPEKRLRPLHPFLEGMDGKKKRGVILEVKRASPSKGDISPDLDSYSTALSYAESGAAAISCLTEERFFKGNLEDLMQVCRAADDYAEKSGGKAPSVLRKDFLLSPEEIEVSYRAGADAVLLIARILTEGQLFEMARESERLGLSALVEVRTSEDLEKISSVFSEERGLDRKNFVFGVNSRDLSSFKIDLLKPSMMTEKIKAAVGLDARIVFESGVCSCESASSVGAMGFSGLLLGEAAARNPDMRKSFVDSFCQAVENENSRFWKKYGAKGGDAGKALVKICGLTRFEDALCAEKYGADFLGFVFADAYPRSVTREGRLEKILPHLNELKAKKVAVIVDVTSPEAGRAADLVSDGLMNLIQFHGLSYEEVRERNAGLLKLPHYFAAKTLEDFESLSSKGEMRILLDSKDFIQTTMQSEAVKVTYQTKWLAGGITPENAMDLLQNFSPELIDLSGGVEKEGEAGIKSEEKIKELMQSLGKFTGSL